MSFSASSHAEKKRARKEMSSLASDSVETGSEAEFAPKLKQSVKEPKDISIPISYSPSKPKGPLPPHLRPTEDHRSDVLPIPIAPNAAQPMTSDEQKLRKQWLDIASTLEWQRYSSSEVSTLDELHSKIFGTLEENRIANGWSKDGELYSEQLMRARKIWLAEVRTKLAEWRIARSTASSASRASKRIDSRVWAPVIGPEELENETGKLNLSEPETHSETRSDSSYIEPRSDLRYNRRERILYFFKNKLDYERLLGTWRPLGADPLVSVYRNDPITYRERWLQQRGPADIENAPLLPIAVLDRIIESSNTTTPYIPSFAALKDKMIGINKMECRENYYRPLGARIVTLSWLQPYRSLVGVPEPLEWDSGRYIPKEYEPRLKGQLKPTRSLTPIVPSNPPQHWFHGTSEPKSYDVGCYIPKEFQNRIKSQATHQQQATPLSATLP